MNRGISYLLRKNLVNGGEPDFLIVGAQKAGTTSLFHYLFQSKQIIPAKRKELHFFDHADEFDFNLKSYRNNFLNGRLKKLMGFKTFEATPIMHHPRIPELIQKWFPKIKLVFVLRNPVDRSISHYLHNKRNDRENLEFKEALEAEEIRIDSDLLKIKDGSVWNTYNFASYSYKYRGYYKEQINLWMNYFEHERMFFVKSEDLKQDTQGVVDRLMDFLDLRRFQLRDNVRKHVSSEKLEINDSLRHTLNDHFSIKNEGLSEIVGFEIV